MQSNSRENLKKCNLCSVFQNLDQFHVCKTSIDKKHPHCKSCKYKKYKARYVSTAKPKIPFDVKFWSRVNKTENCWLWTGAISDGYGSVNVGNGKYDKAHRVSYRLLKGGIPNALHLDHLCRQRNCVNPDHLEPVSMRENLNRGLMHLGNRIIVDGKALCLKCKWGHDFNKENTYIRRNGFRQCKVCSRLRKHGKLTKEFHENR